MSELIRAISENGGIVFCGLDSTEIVRAAEGYHKTSGVCTAALGRLLTAACMMGRMQKNLTDTVTIQICGGGPAGRLLAVSDGSGNVKGYIENPAVEGLPVREDGHLNVGAAVGCDGTMAVIRDLGYKQPTIGQVPLVSGEIAEDIAGYYATSEQVPTVCALGVLVNPDLSVACAGGYLIQLLPGATEEEISRLEKNLAGAPSVTEALQSKMRMDDVMSLVLDGFAPHVLERVQVAYHCDCSDARVDRTLRSLGEKELHRMIEEDPIVAIDCQFCGKKYTRDLRTLLASKGENTAENV